MVTWRIAASLVIPLAMVACTHSSHETPAGSVPNDRSAVGSPSREALDGAMPDLVGLSRSQAAERLDHLGLLFEVVATGPPGDGTVVGQNPAAGTPLPASAVVRLVVRCVPAPCPSPLHGTIFDPCTCEAR